nr:hypothetical protein [uncultured Chryseobacterium sp.]
MEYSFRGKNYKVSRFKTFLTNQLKTQSLETVFDSLIEFVHQNEFEFQDLLSILNRYIDYSKRMDIEIETVFDFVNDKLTKKSEYNIIESVLPISNLYNTIDYNYTLNFLDENLGKIPDNTKEKVLALLLKSDIALQNDEIDKAFSILRDCSKQCYNLYIFDSLELKRTIFEKMAIIGELERKSDVAINFYIYYCAFQAGLEFLRFPYLETYRNFRLPYSIVENPEQEIIDLERHLKEKNIDIHSFNSFLQNFYRTEIPKAFKLEHIDINTFNVSHSSLEDLTYYSNYISNLSVSDLISTIEIMTSQKIKVLI